METERGRIDLLDGWRSLAVALMVFYHFLYDLRLFGVMTREQFYAPGLNAMQRFICCSFIFLAGVSARFSRSSLRHGLVVWAGAVAVSLGSQVAGVAIRFGILHFLGTALVLWHFLSPALDKLPPWVTALCAIPLYFVTDHWTDTAQTNLSFLFPLGFTAPGFSSGDYFPLLPWFFLFLLGTAAGCWVREHRERLGRVRLHPALTWLGRHSFLIYLAHQPVLYGISYLIWGP